MRKKGIIVFIIILSFAFCKRAETTKKNANENLSGHKIKLLVAIPQSRAAHLIADLFYKETNAVVQIDEIGYDETLQKSLQDVSAQKPQYDIFEIWYPELGDMVKKNALVDITDWIEKNKETLKPDDYLSTLYDPYTLQKGRRWALPFDGDTHLLFYRKSLLQKYNFSPPETWDEYLKISKHITKKESSNGIYGAAIMGYKIPVLIISSFLNRVGGYGGELLTSDGRPALNTPEVLAALNAFVEHSEYALPSPLETNFEVSRDAFLSGRVAMVEQWTDIGVMAEDMSESSIKGDWGAVQMPRGSGPKARHAPALNAGYSLGISAKAPNQKVAKAFLLFASRPEIMAKYNVINGGSDTTRISVLTSEEYKKFAPEVSVATQAALKHAVPWPTVPGSPKLFKVLAENLTYCLQKRKSPAQALLDTQESWNEILEKNR